MKTLDELIHDNAIIVPRDGFPYIYGKELKAALRDEIQKMIFNAIFDAMVEHCQQYMHHEDK